MGGELKKLRLAGWKSVKHATLVLERMNVLIGANGAGKSNLISFFRLLHELAEQRLQLFIARSGGADALLHYGAKSTPTLGAELNFKTGSWQVRYDMRLAFAGGDRLHFAVEELEYWQEGKAPLHEQEFGHWESAVNWADSGSDQFLTGCRVYHFHDTSNTAKIRLHGYVEDNRVLASDGGNLAAFLFALKQVKPQSYRRIVDTARQVAPFFDDFALAPLEVNANSIRLDWREKGSDFLFGPHQLSDGTLRAMALITLLLQPREKLPSLLVIDEPELGLHPYALAVIVSLLKSATNHCQVLVATQSATLLDHFEAEDVIVVQRQERGTEFVRLQEDKLNEWLEEYQLSELWEKNVIGGGPF
jgi:predicted ATPase